jgi:hypothetical protein
MAFEISDLNTPPSWNSKKFEQKVITPYLFPEAYTELRKMRARSIQLRPTVPIERFQPILKVCLQDLADLGDASHEEVRCCTELLGWAEPQQLADVITFDTSRAVAPALALEHDDAKIIPFHHNLAS